MGERGLSTPLAVALAAVAGLLVASLLADWVVVEVTTPAPDRVALKLPLPLSLAEAATAFVPDHALDAARLPAEVAESREAVLAGLAALAEAPDAILLTVDAPDARVRVATKGGVLEVSVDSQDAVVHCALPVDGVREALEHWDWHTPDPELAFHLLDAATSGNVVTVETSDGVRVAIDLW